MAIQIEDNETAVRRLYEEVNAGIKSISIPLPGVQDSQKQPLKHFATFFYLLRDSFSGCELTINKILSKGDKVMVKYSVCGTQNNEFLGVPPSKDIMIVTGLDVFRFDKGKVVEYWDTAHQITAQRTVRY